MSATEKRTPPQPPGPLRVVVLALAATAGALDQLTKWIASGVLVPGRTTVLIPGFLEFRLRANPHGAFGLFADMPEDLRLPVLLALSVLAMLAIVSFSLRTLGWSPATSASLGLILGGALSNLADRAFFGRVLDFIDLRLGSRFAWPTFNLADVAISAGSLILVAVLIRTWSKKMKLEEANEP